MAKGEVRTQRAHVIQWGDGFFDKEGSIDGWNYAFDESTPVLVVPEAAVAKCKHASTIAMTTEGGATHSWCRDCGRLRMDGRPNGMLPRIFKTRRTK